MIYADKAMIVILERDITLAERGKVLDLLNGVVHTRKYGGRKKKGEYRPTPVLAGVFR
jgi:hypothetical protein